MGDIDRYCRMIKNKTEKLLKKIFGFSSLKYAIQAQKYFESQLEAMTGKKIENIQIEDVKTWKNGCYEFAKYRTLKRIINLYLDSTTLEFNSDEMKEYLNECK